MLLVLKESYFYLKSYNLILYYVDFQYVVPPPQPPSYYS
jgi:hypothetical protein